MATLARLRQVHSLRCTEPRDWNDLSSFSVMIPKSMSDLAERFGLLHTVDWPEPVRESKTHRVLHTMPGLSASTHRYFFSKKSSTSSCSLNPCLGLLVMICPMQCSAEAICSSLAGHAWFALRLCCITRLWALPVLTYIVVRSLGMKRCVSADTLLILVAHGEVLVWPLTQTSCGRLTHGTASGEASCHVSCQEWCPSRVRNGGHRPEERHFQVPYTVLFNTVRPLVRSEVCGRGTGRHWLLPLPLCRRRAYFYLRFDDALLTEFLSIAVFRVTVFTTVSPVSPVTSVASLTMVLC